MARGEKIGKVQKFDVAILIISILEMYAIMKISDLPPALGNWSEKSREILNLNYPKNNFYPPGASIMLLPFIWNSPNFLVANYFYWSLSIFGILKLSKFIESRKFQRIAVLFFLLNPYLPWLCYSSQDTVFELFLLVWSLYALISKRYITYLIFFYLLCMTRPAYWCTFFAVSLVLFFLKNESRRKIQIICLCPLIFLVLTLGINKINLNSFEIASEKGITLYFSHNRYSYLALPKFDIDVFLAKGGHMEITDDENSPSITRSDDFTTAALHSLRKYPKEAILSTLTNIDSYIFSSQKVPNLPGEYYLNPDANSIVIGKERLTWPIVIGNAVFFILRSVQFILFLLTIGSIFHLRGLKLKKYKLEELALILPWIVGLIPSIIFYSETRFKIVSESLLILGIGVLRNQSAKEDRNCQTSTL